MYGPMGDSVFVSLAVFLLLLVSAAIWYPLAVRFWRRNRRSIEAADDDLQKEALFERQDKERYRVTDADSVDEKIRKLRLQSKERGRLR